MNTPASLRDHVINQYWLKKLSCGNRSGLPAAGGADGFGSVEVVLDAECSGRLAKMTKGNDVALFTICLSVWKMVLSHYFQDDKLLIVTPEIGVGRIPVATNRIAFFETTAVSTLPVIKEVIDQTASEIRQYDSYKTFQFHELSQEFAHHDIRQENLFQFGFEFPLLTSKSSFVDTSDLKLIVNTSDSGRIALTVVFNRARFNQNFALWIKEFIVLHIVRLHQVLLLPVVELRKQFFLEAPALFSASTAMPAAGSTDDVVSLFRQQVANSPDAIALVSSDCCFTYSFLDQRSNDVAQMLLQRDEFSPGGVVGVMLERSEKVYMAILGIFKAGGCFLPIDYEHPEERVEFILNDTRPCVVLCEESTSRASYLSNENVVHWHLIDWTGYGHRVTLPGLRRAMASYIVYTSGSTGRPKGIVQTHLTLANLIKHDISSLPINPKSRLLMHASISFDAALNDPLFVLCGGGVVCIADEQVRLNFARLKDFVLQHKIQILSLSYSVLRNFFNYFQPPDLSGHSIEHIVSTGEQMVVVKGLKSFVEANPRVMLHNFYGPSETHVVTTHSFSGYEMVNDYVPIGTPVCNTSIYLLDDAGSFVPKGAVGEVYVGGNNLAIGYLNQPETSTDRFVTLSFSTAELFYKTGDRARYITNDCLEYLGRKDEQVKINGYRVEPAELASVLKENDAILDCAVRVMTNNDGENMLVAYIVQNDVAISTGDIKNYLSSKLPRYLLPHYIIPINKIPTTSNGKLDVNKLPDPYLDNEGLIPAGITPQQTVLLNLMREVLERKDIGIRTDFFRAGGHSLKAMHLVSRIYEKLGVEISLSTVFAHHSVEELALQLEAVSDFSLSPLDPIEEQYYYRASHAQKRMYVEHEMAGNNAYNVVSVSEFSGELSYDAIRSACSEVMRKYEILRTTFFVRAGELFQKISPPSALELPLFLELCLPDKREWLEERVNEVSNTPFVLENGPLFKIHLLTEGVRHWFVLVKHHIITDVGSIEIFLDEVQSLYQQTVQGSNKIAAATNTVVQYKDYTAWQNHILKGNNFERHIQLWRQRLDEEPATVILPSARQRPDVKSYKGELISTEISAPLFSAVRKVAQHAGTSAFITMFTALVAFLHRYTGQKNLLMGVLVNDRNLPVLQRQMGFFVNIILLNSRFVAEKNFLEMLDTMIAMALEGYKNQSYPFDKLLEDLKVKRDLNYNPLCEAVVDYWYRSDSTSKERASLPSPTTQSSKFDLIFHFVEFPDKLDLAIEFNTDIYAANDIVAVADCFVKFLEKVASRPESNVSSIALFDDNAIAPVFHEFNRQLKPSFKVRHFYEIIEEVFRSSAGQSALLVDDRIITYGELSNQVEALAEALQGAGVCEGDFVGIHMDRTERMITAILAVMKVRGVFVPIDPDSPLRRQQYMIDDTALLTLLSDRHTEAGKLGFTLLGEGIIYGKQTHDGRKRERAGAPGPYLYVMYTSGSTGVPKGVLTENIGLIALFDWAVQLYREKQFDVVLAGLSICFDYSLLEIFLPLALGRKVRLLRNGLEIYDYVSCEKEIALFTVPSLVSELLDQGVDFSNVKIANLAGEKLYDSIKTKLDLQRTELYNLYGPTENSILTTGCKITSEGDNITIGYPIIGSKVYIVDEYLNPLPVGFTGQVAIAGIGLSPGYLNRPELTHEKFLLDTFGKDERLYLSGDLGRWLPDGKVEYLGRIDSQLKIRGYRIEKDEVELALSVVKGIKHCVVVQRNSAGGQPELIAYYTSATPMSSADIRHEVSKYLPGYMIPSHFVELNNLPLNPNGKIDFKALPEPKEEVPALSLPTGEIQKQLCHIWREVLGHDRFGVSENFFEIGGTSLKLIELLRRITEMFDVRIPIAMFFNHPTIQKQSQLINGMAPAETQIRELEF